MTHPMESPEPDWLGDLQILTAEEFEEKWQLNESNNNDEGGKTKVSDMKAAKTKHDKILLSLELTSQEIERTAELRRMAVEREQRAAQLQSERAQKDAELRAKASRFAAERRRSRCVSQWKKEAEFESQRCDVKRECITTCRALEKEANEMMTELQKQIEYKRKAVNKALGKSRDKAEKERLAATLAEAEETYKKQRMSITVALKRKRAAVKIKANNDLNKINVSEAEHQENLEKELNELNKTIKEGTSSEIRRKVSNEIPASALEKLEKERDEALTKLEKQRKAATRWYEKKRRAYLGDLQKERAQAVQKLMEKEKEIETRTMNKMRALDLKRDKFDEAMKKREEKLKAVMQKREEERLAELKRREEKRAVAKRRIEESQRKYEKKCEERSLQLREEIMSRHDKDAKITKKKKKLEIDPIAYFWRRFTKLAKLEAELKSRPTPI